MGESAGNSNADSADGTATLWDQIASALGIEEYAGAPVPGGSTDTATDNTLNAPTDVSSAIQSILPSSTSITVWLVLIVIGLLAFAYITREVAG